MPHLLSSSGGFALEHGRMIGHTPFLYVARPGHDAGVRVPCLGLVIVEPVERVPGDAAVASRIIHGLVQSLRDPGNASVVQSLRDAVDVANETLLRENRRRGSVRHLYFGMSAVVLGSERIVIAQLPPTQILVRAGYDSYELPALGTWLPVDLPDPDPILDGDPLGSHLRVAPHIAQLPCSHDNTILALSSSVARLLAGSDETVDGSQLLGSRLELVSRLSRLAGATPAYAAGLQTVGVSLDASERTMHTDTGRNGLSAGPIVDQHANSTSSSGSDPRSIINPFASGWLLHPARTPDTTLTLSSGTIRFSEPESRAADDAPANLPTNRRVVRSRSYRETGRYEVVEIFAGLLLSLTAAVVGVWRMTSRDRPIHGPRDDGTLGIPHLQRWSDGYRKPRFERLHRIAPRVEISRIVVVLALLVVLAGVATVAYTLVLSGTETSGLVESDEFGEIVTLHAEANQASDTVARYDLLIEARDRITNLTAGVPDEQVDQRVIQERNSILADLERLTSSTMVDNVQIVGGLPDLPADTSPQLFTGGGSVYLLADALYEVHAVNSTLVKLIEPGDTVEGETVGPLLGGTWREDGPLVVDSNAAYVLDIDQGTWSREPLGRLGDGETLSPQAIDVYDYNLYALDTDQGRILKYVAGDYGAEPEDWTGGLAADALQHAVDIEIDGNIYVLLPDGRVLSFYLSALEEQWQPAAVPPIESAATLVRHAGSQYFYVANASDGRILRVNNDGELVQQFQTVPDLPSLANITDLVIDEETRIAYAVVADGVLVTIRLPGPENGNGSARTP